jgi:hypothetical protein
VLIVPSATLNPESRDPELAKGAYPAAGGSGAQEGPAKEKRHRGTHQRKMHGCMYSRTVSIQYRSHDGQVLPCPMKWLDNFSMRNFTNDPIFDDTLPVADGLMQIGTRVPLDRLRDAMEDWFRRKSYLPKQATLEVEENLVNE